LPPDFQHHGAQRIAGQRIGGGAQRGLHIGGAHRHKPTRIETEFGQTAHRQRARFNFGEILAHPYQRPQPGRPPRKARGKTRGRSTLPACFGKHLVHSAQGKAAQERRIGFPMAERHPARRIGIAWGFDALDVAAQGRKRARACADHALLLFRVTREPAHLFMICSI
jgi:hypothetical protein